MDLLFPLLFIFFIATFTQSVSGFGGALVAMPLLTAGVLPIEIAAPLFAVAATASRPFMILRYRSAFTLSNIWRLVVAAIFAIPLGVHLLGVVDEQIIRAVLAFVVIGYVVLNLALDRLPKLEHPLWGYVMGFVGGLLAGAYNIGGPPAVMYATGRKWLADEFRANLQTYSLVNNIVVVLAHARNGNLTTDVLHLFVLIMPTVFLGLILGFALNDRINQDVFRKIVLLLLFISGVRLLL